ncbi:hypothetical protein R69927_07429 [Paraburkholderia domus]|nr:hypothetical protein R69927_07429 [Paraburkholderia domus]
MKQLDETKVELLAYLVAAQLINRSRVDQWLRADRVVELMDMWLPADRSRPG